MKKSISLIIALILLFSVTSCSIPNDTSQNGADSDVSQIETSDLPGANDTAAEDLPSELPIISATVPYPVQDHEKETDLGNIYVNLEKASYTSSEKITITVGNKNAKPFDLCERLEIQKYDPETGEWVFWQTDEVVPAILTTIIAPSTDIIFNPKSAPLRLPTAFTDL